MTNDRTSERARIAERAGEVADLARWAHARGWVPATSGNFSARVSDDPLRLAITASGFDKSTLSADGVVVVDDQGKAVGGDVRPSAEVLLHVLVARVRRANVVAHVHSIWSTLASELRGGTDALVIDDLELLKAFDGVSTHAHREVVPIVDNSQDWPAALADLETRLATAPRSHGFLIRGHGLYTWGATCAEVRRHLEAFEFLFELVIRRTDLHRSATKGDSGWPS